MELWKDVSNQETVPNFELALARVYASLKHLLVLQLLKRKWQLAFWAATLFLFMSLWLCAVVLLSLFLAGLT
jgi:hypothetical protein